MRVPQDIIDCFLRHAKTGRFGIRFELVRRIAGIKMRRQAGDAGLAVEMRAQRRGEPEIIELRRPQAERELPHALERVLHRLDAFAHASAQRRVARALN